MTKSTKSIRSPLNVSRDSARGGPAERTKRYKARDSVESGVIEKSLSMNAQVYK